MLRVGLALKRSKTTRKRSFKRGSGQPAVCNSSVIHWSMAPALEKEKGWPAFARRPSSHYSAADNHRLFLASVYLCITMSAKPWAWHPAPRSPRG